MPGVGGAVAREDRGAGRLGELAGERAPPRQRALHRVGEPLAAVQEPRDPRRLGETVAAGQERARGQGQAAQHEATPVERARAQPSRPPVMMDARPAGDHRAEVVGDPGDRHHEDVHDREADQREREREVHGAGRLTAPEDARAGAAAPRRPRETSRGRSGRPAGPGPRPPRRRPSSAARCSAARRTGSGSAGDRAATRRARPGRGRPGGDRASGGGSGSRRGRRRARSGRRPTRRRDASGGPWPATGTRAGWPTPGTRGPRARRPRSRRRAARWCRRGGPRPRSPREARRRRWSPRGGRGSRARRRSARPSRASGAR